MQAEGDRRERASMEARDRPYQRRSVLAAAIVVVLLAALGGGTANADELRRTEGDARASFNAEPGGGMAIAFKEGPHGTPAVGAPPTGGIPPERLGTDPKESVRIYPLANGSYCASGWHVIFVSWWVTESELASGFGAEYYDNYNDAFAYLSSVDVQFAWDGTPLVEERTANKRLVDFPEPGLEDVFWFNVGTFMPPGTLSVGKHRLTMTVIDPLFGDGKLSVNITILPC
jgi:hypothetical protein